MNHRLCIFAIIAICFLPGCKRSTENNTTQTTEAEKLDIPDAQKAQDTSPSIECHNGTALKDGKCVCDDGKELLGEGWYCLTNGQICMLKNDCIIKEQSFDMGVVFRDNHFYCGDVRAPLSVEAFAGEYRCKIDYKEWSCWKEECKCGNEMIEEYDYCNDNPDKSDNSISDSLPGTEAKDQPKPWVCTDPNGCACGDSVCRNGETCIDQSCVADTKPVKNCLGFPLQEGYRCATALTLDHESYEIGQACDRENCPCGNTTCKKDEFCSNGHCLIETDKPFFTLLTHYPSRPDGLLCQHEEGCLCQGKNIDKDKICALPCYHDGKLVDDECWCGKDKLADMDNEACFKQNDQYLVLCNNQEGCPCGDSKCPMTTLCSENQCIEPLTSQPIVSSSDKLQPVTSCKEKECICGNNKCTQGQFCIGNICRDRIFATIKNGKRIFYNDDAFKEIIEDGFGDAISSNSLKHELQSGLLDVFEYDNINLSEYMLTPYISHTRVDQAEDYYWNGSQFRCGLASGCTCGSQNCNYGVICNNGKCNDDIDFGYIYCNDEEVRGTPVLDYEGISFFDGHCYCNGMSYSPATSDFDRYECYYNGWICKHDCKCGDVRCKDGEYCLKPGSCVGQK